MKKVLIASMLMPTLALALFANPALARHDFDSVNIITVSNNNSAQVGNMVLAGASTGGNSANGGEGSGAGDGGNVYDSEDGNTGGNGGNGGNGGSGGEIGTGNAVTVVEVINDVNNNDTTIEDGCGCDEEDSDDTRNETSVNNHNDAGVLNLVGAGSDTGYNDANGGDAGGCECGQGAGNGGNVNSSDDDNTGGNGGNAGNGGRGGYIATGNAGTGVGILNVINTNITRIRR
jgi:hypothetical protein